MWKNWSLDMKYASLLRAVQRLGRLFFFLLCLYFLVEYIRNNEPYFDVDTNYLHWSSVLPAISICELPRRKMNKNKEFLRRLIRPSDEGYCYGCNQSNQYPTSGYSVILEKVLTPCQNLFASCQWNEVDFECCRRFKILRTPYGVCFSVNSEITEPSEKFEVSFFSKDAILNIKVTSRVQVYLHDPRDVGFILKSAQNERVPKVLRPGTRMEVVYTSREVKAGHSARYLTRRQRGCALQASGGAQPLPPHYPAYSQSTCEALCSARAQASACNCTHHLMPIIGDHPECDLEGLMCIDQNVKKGKKHDKCECLPACDEIEPTLVWINFQKVKNTNLIEVRLKLSSPPTERLIIKARAEPLDILVAFACFTRLFTNINLVASANWAYHYCCVRKYPRISYQLPNSILY